MVVAVTAKRANPTTSFEQLLDDITAQKTVGASYQCNGRNCVNLGVWTNQTQQREDGTASRITTNLLHSGEPANYRIAVRHVGTNAGLNGGGIRRTREVSHPCLWLTIRVTMRIRMDRKSFANDIRPSK